MALNSVLHTALKSVLVTLNTGYFSFGLTRQSEQCTEVLFCTVEQAGNNLLKYTKIITI